MKKKFMILGLTIFFILGFLCVYLSSNPVSCTDLGCAGVPICPNGIKDYTGCLYIQCTGGGGIHCEEPI